jgi:hypothetical protein
MGVVPNIAALLVDSVGGARLQQDQPTNHSEGPATASPPPKMQKMCLAPPPPICHTTGMTADILENELKTLPEAERTRIIRGALQELSPSALKALERQLRRFAHPEVPEDVWTGFEEAEDGRGIEVRDEHFEHPPI